MIDALWMARHRATHVLLLCALAASVASVLRTEVFSVAGSAVNAVSAVTGVLVWMAPIYGAVMLGAASDADLETARCLAGLPRHRHRIGLTSAFGALLVGLALLVFVVAFVGGLTRIEPFPDGSPPAYSAAQQALAAALTLVAVVAVTSIICLGRPTGRALMGAAVIGAATFLVSAGSAQAPVLLKSLWPPTSASVLAGAGNGYAREDALLAGATLILSLAIAAFVLTNSSSGIAPAARRSSTAREHWQGSPRVLTVSAVGLVVVASALLPTLARALPPSARPSLLIQAASGQAPVDVARAYVFAFQQGDLDTVQRLAVRRHGQVDSATPPREMNIPGPAQTFALVRVEGLERATVTASLPAGRYAMCLVRQDAHWRIEQIEVGFVCPA